MRAGRSQQGLDTLAQFLSLVDDLLREISQLQHELVRNMILKHAIFFGFFLITVVIIHVLFVQPKKSHLEEDKSLHRLIIELIELGNLVEAKLTSELWQRRKYSVLALFDIHHEYLADRRQVVIF